MTKQRYATLGSVSSGTLRTDDLLEAFVDALSYLDEDRADAIQEELDALDMDTEEGMEQAEMILNDDLFDALDEYAPPFCYFGANEGDGADFGFWFSSESFEEACESGEVLKLEAVDEWPTELADDVEYVAFVTDHGNVSLYSVSDRETPIWEIV